ncbi:MAG: glutamate synthase subunit beta [Deltaproteobacteria bacterium]|nr:glutamate synthase subunit beta [Deltaproteobacteria bacterium]
MGKITGFMEYHRDHYPERPVADRVQDYKEIYTEFPVERLRVQGARCMDCGIPFCHQGCPLGNLIPDWNDLVYKNRWQEAIERLHATNNFPEFTGTLCPAPCEGSCVLGINDKAVTIKYIELNIIERAFKEGWVQPQPPKKLSGKKVAVVGSGPAGLACAQQLRRAGHEVTVFERSDRIGGLLRYGIPDFKMEKRRIDFRIEQMKAEGVVFKTNANIGVNVPVEDLKKNFDAVSLCGGASQARDLPVPGRELKGTYLAVEFLAQENKKNAGDSVAEQVTAKGKRVVILGGGDTGADCLGTSVRQGAKSIHQFELLSRPPMDRAPNNPWPQWPAIFRTSPAHQEALEVYGGQDVRDYCIMTKSLSGEGGVLKKLHAVRLEWTPNPNGGPPQMKEVPGSEFEIECDLLLLAMGFTGSEKPGMIEQLGVQLDQRTNIVTDDNYMTNVPAVFAAGDQRRGQSLIVWAIAEGRKCARGIDRFLMGESELAG